MTVIAGPLLAGVALPAARYWAGDSRRDGRPIVPLVVATLTALGLLVLLPWAGSELALSITWLPGTGPMAIGLGGTGLYVALATTGACALALWGERAKQSYWMGALALLAIAAAQIAFLAEHFLARYVALEIVALCVALAPLADLQPTGDGVTGGGLTRLVYLVLRLGDVGLLVAILVLWSVVGTLDIAPALEMGHTLDATRLNWVVAGFILAVWVKVGGWPVHLWLQAGEHLSLFSHSWLFATLMPNLGLYLLYRVTPLLAHAGGMQWAVYGVGALGAALAAVLALATTRSGSRLSLVYLGAALGGLALLMAASGLQTVVWMTALVVTPLRLLFHVAGRPALAGEPAPVGAGILPPQGRSPLARAMVTGLYALGGLALAGYCVLCAWWIRRAGAPPGVALMAEFAVCVIGIAMLRSASALWRRSHPAEAAAREVPASRPAQRRPLEGLPVLALLGGIVLAGMLFFEPLIGHLTGVAHGSPLVLPGALEAARYLATTPAFWGALVLAVVGRRTFLRPQVSPAPPTAVAGDRALNLDQGLDQAAQILGSVVEVGIQERVLGAIVRGVLNGARATQRIVEQRMLNDSIQRVSEAVVLSGRLAYRVLEQEGLEGLLHGTVRAVLAGGRTMQRWHTGRLRRNLSWVAACLLLAIAALMFYGW